MLAKQVVRETKETVEQTGARPRAAFQTAKRQCLVRDELETRFGSVGAVGQGDHPL